MPTAEVAPSVLLSSPLSPLSQPVDTESKAALRLRARRRRAEAFAGGADVPAVVAGLAQRAGILAASRNGAVVAGYWPIRDELDCRPLLANLAEIGWECALPVVIDDNGPLVFRRWRLDEALVPGRFGIAEPCALCPAVTPDVVLVPMLAFDRNGHRLGHGAGYYDRTLAELRRRHPAVLAVGLAFAAQEVHALPAEPHDQRLDWIVTEAGACRVR